MTDSLMSVTRQAVDGHEFACKIQRVVKSDSDAERASAELDLSCTGEGETWRSREVCLSQRIGGRKHMVTVEVARQDERGRAVRPPRRDTSVRTAGLYLQ